MIEIRHYTNEFDNCPIQDWLGSLRDRNAKAKILTCLDRLSLGNFGDHKSVTNSGGVSELRINVGKGYRVYYGEINNEVVLLLCGGNKHDQQRDIKTAIKYWSQYKQEVSNA